MDFNKKEMPIQGYTGFGGGATGLSFKSAGDKTYVDDVFAMYAYSGNSNSLSSPYTRDIVTDLDFAEHGGMVWFKERTGGQSNVIFDTERQAENALETAGTAGTEVQTTSVKAFNSNGVTVGTGGKVNDTGKDYITWQFRKCEKFFDLVKYTGNGANNRSIDHDLNCTVGCIIVKRFDQSGQDWVVYHRGNTKNAAGSTVDPEGQILKLNETDDTEANTTAWANTAPTSSVFYVSNFDATNASGGEYIAYLFAHNDGDGEFGDNRNADIIKCGSYDGNSSPPNDVDLGFQPQFIFQKNGSTDTGGSWNMMDTLRGIRTNGYDAYNRANISQTETYSFDFIDVLSDGFSLTDSGGNTNTTGRRYIYIAIRKADGVAGKIFGNSDATKVFATTTGTSSSTIPNFVTNFPVDWFFMKKPAATSDWYTYVRHRSTTELQLNSGANAGGASDYTFDSSTGFGKGQDNSTWQGWAWRSWAGFDQVAYTGTGSSQDIAHGLGRKPEMIIFKRTSGGSGNKDWLVMHAGHNLGVNGYTYRSYLAYSDIAATGGVSTAMWDEPSATTFNVKTLSDLNESGSYFNAYLFASVSGVTKLGYWQGNGSASGPTITTGFSPRFLMYKKTTNSGDFWQMLDTTRGLGSGDDKPLEIAQTGAQTTIDLVTPSATGFQIVSDDDSINANGAKYIYYAHA